MYARELDGEPHDFGALGLETGSQIMYDQQTRSWWSQLFGEAVNGPMKGRKLDKLPSTMTTWAKWRQLHPDTTVYVKRSVEYRPDHTDESFAKLATRGPEGPLAEKDWVIGVEGRDQARVYPVRRLLGERLVRDELEGEPILVYLAPDLASAKVYSGAIAGGGSRKRELSFVLGPDERLRDRETGSIWEPLTGSATSGPLQGHELSPVISTYSLWYAWKKYRPDTVVWGADE